MEKARVFMACTIIIVLLWGIFSIAQGADGKTKGSRFSEEECSECRGPSGELMKLMREIQVLNLINGLYLSKDQSQSLFSLIVEEENLTMEFQSKLNSLDTEAVAALKKVKGELLAGESLSPGTGEKMGRVEHQVQDIRYNYETAKRRILERAYDLLNENQRILICGYEPCIQPQSSTANPERIGQSGSGEHLEKMLTDIRKVPAERFPEVKEHVLSDVRKMLTLHFGEEGAEKELKKLESAMTEARALSDEEFELQKTKLVEKIKPPKPSSSDKKLCLDKIEKFLVTGDAIDLFKEKMGIATK